MEIKDLMTPQPAFLFPDTTVLEAATAMEAPNIGLLPVGDGERVPGVITDRDKMMTGMPSRGDIADAPSRKAIALEEA